MKPVTTRQSIAKNIQQNTGTSMSDAKLLTECILEGIMELLYANGKCTLKSFGSFVSRQHAAKIGHNPKTMEKVHIKARKSVSFKPTRELNKKINHDQQ